MLLALCLAGCKKYAINSEGGSVKNRARLFDFRPGPLATTPVRDEALLKAFIPAAHFGCKQKAHSEDEIPKMRADGDTQPLILGEARGVFSESGKQERALLIARGECSDNTSWQTREVVVLPAAGTQPIARADVTDNHLLKTADLNQDGQDELYLTESGRRDGIETEQARIYQFDHGKLRKLEDFGTVYENYCGSSITSQGLSAVVVDYIPRTEKEQLPRFVAQLYRAACPAHGAQPNWVMVTPK